MQEVLVDTTPYPKVSIDEHSIIHLELGSGSIDVSHLREANSKHRALSKVPRPVMISCNAGNKISINTEAMEYCSSKEATDVTTAFALVAQSFIQRYLAKVLMTFHSPPKPTRLFSNKQDALKWLHDCEGAQVPHKQTA